MFPDPDWQLIGTFWPLAGLGLVAIAAILASGRLCWWILVLGPVAVMAPCFFYAEAIAYNGNLLFTVIFLCSLIGLMLYYLLLIAVAVVLLVRKRSRQHPQA